MSSSASGIKPERDLFDYAPLVTSLLIAAASVYIVHQLTRQREKEKAVFDGYRRIKDELEQTRLSAIIRWTTKSAPKRKASISATLAGLQKVGGTVQQIRKLSTRRSIRSKQKQLCLSRQMARLRDDITLNDFDDEGIKHQPSKEKSVEDAIADFVIELDQKFLDWIE